RLSGKLEKKFRGPPRQRRQFVGQHQDPDAHQKRAAQNFTPADERLIAVEKTQEPVNAQARQNERNSKPRRINQKQKTAPPRGLFARGQRQNTGQDGPDARRPTESESQSHDESPRPSRRDVRSLKALLVVKPADRQKPGHVQSEQDDNDPRRLFKPLQMIPE